MTKVKPIALKGERCAGCTGTRAQHQDEGDGCWCPTCLALPVGQRCRNWQPVMTDPRKPVNRKVAPVGRNHPQTAKDAAGRKLLRAGTQRAEVYGLIVACGIGGLTDDEMEQALLKSHQSISATRNTLMKDGWIVDSGKRRETQYGNDAIVWVTAECADQHGLFAGQSDSEWR